jgi:hypothetical protein
MGRTLIKPDRNDDFYVEWSSIVESPMAWGTREEMLAELDVDGEERLARADEYGTSALWGNPRAYGFDDDGVLIYQQRGVLRHDQLKQLCTRLGENEEADISDLLAPFDDDDR